MWLVAGKFEPQTPSLQGLCANHLVKGISHQPSSQGTRSMEHSRGVTATSIRGQQAKSDMMLNLCISRILGFSFRQYIKDEGSLLCLQFSY